jgi:hypothetical protein
VHAGSLVHTARPGGAAFFPVASARCTLAGMAAGIQIAVRIDADLLARIDAMVAKLSTDWRQASRSDVIRALCIKALPLLEAEGAEPEHKTRKGR